MNSFRPSLHDYAGTADFANADPDVNATSSGGDNALHCVVMDESGMLRRNNQVKPFAAC
jgi:hypothetical protein